MNNDYNEPFFTELIRRFHNSESIMRTVAVDYPMIFRDIQPYYLKEMLPNIRSYINIDHLIYSSCNTPEVFKIMLENVDLYNVTESEYYEYFELDMLYVDFKSEMITRIREELEYIPNKTQNMKTNLELFNSFYSHPIPTI